MKGDAKKRLLLAAGLLTLLLGVGAAAALSAYNRLSDALNEMTQPSTPTRELGVYVLAEDPAQAAVLEAVLALPAKYRLPVHLHYYEGLKIEEIAAVLRISPGAVKQRLFRARKLLRAALEEGGADHV